jgi:hypothetical protein
MRRRKQAKHATMSVDREGKPVLVGDNPCDLKPGETMHLHGPKTKAERDALINAFLQKLEREC